MTMIYNIITNELHRKVFGFDGLMILTQFLLALFLSANLIHPPVLDVIIRIVSRIKLRSAVPRIGFEKISYRKKL